MAEANISVDQDQFRCSVCLDLLNHPVTIPCGHTYCMRCISECWDQDDQKGIYSCPQCRQIFKPRPVLCKNVVFAEIVEKLKKTRLQAAPVPARRRLHAGSGDVQCDSCTGIKQKAVKSCLECRISYCQTHLEQHESLFRGKKHNLMDATGRLQELICTQHDKILEIYCRTDQSCICMTCLMDEHKNHDTVSTAAERKEKQSHFEEMQRKFQKLIHQREKDLQELRVAVDSHKRSAQTAVEDSERVFTELICSIEKRRSEVMKLIRDQERAAVSRAEEQLERLKKEIDDLKRKDAELKQLSETQDHVHFLHSWPSVSLTGSTDSFTVSAHLYFDDVVKSVSQLRDKLQQLCTDEIQKLSKTVKTVQVILTPEYETREEFLPYSLPEMFLNEEPLFNIECQYELYECEYLFGVSGAKPPAPAPVSLFGVSDAKPPAPAPVNLFGVSDAKPPAPAPVSLFGVSGAKSPLRAPVSLFGVSGAKPPLRAPVSLFGVSGDKPPLRAPVSLFGVSDAKPPAPAPVNLFGVSDAKPPLRAPVSLLGVSGAKPPAPVSLFGVGGDKAFGLPKGKPPAPASVRLFGAGGGKAFGLPKGKPPAKTPAPAPVSLFGVSGAKPPAPAPVSLLGVSGAKPSAPVSLFGVGEAKPLVCPKANLLPPPHKYRNIKLGDSYLL